MARQRVIKPEFWTSEDIISCSSWARLLFIGLWNFADDNGVIKNSPMRLKMQIFPVDNQDVSALIKELENRDMVEIFMVDGEEWIWIKNFLKYQYIERPTPTNNPPPPFTESSLSPHGILTEDSPTIHGGFTEDSPTVHPEKNRTEQKGTEQKRKQKKTNKQNRKQNKQTEQNRIEQQVPVAAAVASFASALGKGNCSAAAASPGNTYRPVASELVRIGVSMQKTEELLSRYPEESIRNQIDWLPFRNLNKPVAGLIKAIEQNWEMPAMPQTEKQKAEMEHLTKVRKCAEKYPDCAKLNVDMCSQCPNVLKKRSEKPDT